MGLVGLLSTRTGEQALRGGMDLVVSLTADQQAALGVDAGLLAEAFDTVLVGLAALRSGQDPRPVGGRVSMKDQPTSAGLMWDEWLLADTAALLARVEGTQQAAIRAHAEHGGSYGRLAAALGVARATAQSRRDELHRSGPGAGELWATGGFGPVDHPGVRVPAAMRPWSTPWHGYLPIEITPPELRSAALAEQVPDWSEPYATPQQVPDWAERRSAALVPFDLDHAQWPLNPAGRTGRSGRNLGKWGENSAADPIVVAGSGEQRRVLLIERDDVHQWAISGGMVDPGEAAPDALVRELREETGVDLRHLVPTVLDRVLVEDWRNTDHAWVASTVALFELPTTVTATAADDAADAGWWPFGSLDELEAALAAAGKTLYGAHRPLLQLALDHLDSQG